MTNLKKYSLTKLNDNDKELLNVGLQPDLNKLYKEFIISNLDKENSFSDKYKYLLNEINKTEYILEEITYNQQSIREFLKKKISELIIQCSNKNNNCLTEIPINETNKLYVSNSNNDLDYSKYKGVVLILSNEEIRETMNQTQIKQLLNRNILRISNVNDEIDKISEYINNYLKKGDVIIVSYDGLIGATIGLFGYLIKYKKDLIDNFSLNGLISYVQQFRMVNINYSDYNLLDNYNKLNNHDKQEN